MPRFRRNKSELIVLTGAIYSVVAYLTAFALEILFLIDLGQRNGEILSGNTEQANAAITSSTTTILTAKATTTTPTAWAEAGARPPGMQILPTAQRLASYFNNGGGGGGGGNGNGDADGDSVSSSFERFALEAMQAHITISCLAISILYFVIFVTSLILIVALILRSTFMLLVWMCAMATMYLPELALVIYVSIYSWGLGSRNGQTELAFYLFRAALNLIFIFRAHKLFKQWNYEKNFFRLKSGGAGGSPAAAISHFGCRGYGSPFFISGDSLTTTINPVFAGSTLSLNRYDYVRSCDHQQLASF